MTLTLFGVAIVPAIVGLVELCKRVGLPGQFAPVAAIVFGALAAAAEVYQAQLPWLPAAVEAIALGLSACGLYDAGTSAPTYLQTIMAFVTATLTKQAPPAATPPGPASQ